MIPLHELLSRIPGSQDCPFHPDCAGFAAWPSKTRIVVE